MQNHLQVLEDLEVDQVFKLDVVALGRDAIFSLLPELVRDVVVGETLTVEHQDLEQVLDTESKTASLHVELALRFGVF